MKPPSASKIDKLFCIYCYIHQPALSFDISQFQGHKGKSENSPGRIKPKRFNESNIDKRLISFNRLTSVAVSRVVQNKVPGSACFF